MCARLCATHSIPPNSLTIILHLPQPALPDSCLHSYYTRLHHIQTTPRMLPGLATNP